MDINDRNAADLKNDVDRLKRLIRFQENQIHFLERERQKFSALVNHTDAGFAIINSDYKVTWTNRAVREHLVSSDIAGGAKDVNCRELLCFHENFCEACPVSRALETGEVAHHEGHTGNSRKSKYLYLTAIPINSLEGKPDEAMVMFQDVTDLEILRNSQAQLRESEVRFRTLFENSPVAIAVAREGINLYANNAYLKMFGFERVDEIVGKPISDHWAPEWRAVVAEYGHHRMGGLPVPPEYEAIAQRKNGSRFPALLALATMDLPDGRTTVCFVTDLSEQKGAEEDKLILERQLQQAQKIESVGRLAGGIAHDFNNMLEVILGYAEIALEEVDATQLIYHDLTEIIKAGRRSADLVSQLLAFARRQTIAPKVLNLNETISSMLKMLGRLIGENISLDWQAGANLWPVRIDPSQFDQILTNLCVNSRDSIPDVGRVVIETGNYTLDDEYCARHRGSIAGEYVRVAVIDNGCGMDKKMLDQIFEPFFTTKGVGQGTGLGLATVYGAVKQNNGYIDVESEPGSGTTISIYLPRYECDVGHSWLGEASASIEGRETILLVEDESAILNLTAEMLKRLGYSVLAANTPGEALHLAMEHRSEISMLLSDIILPEMNGHSLAEKLKTIHPQMKCLFMSGYPSEVITQQGMLQPGMHFLQKPFSKNELVASLQKL